MLHQMVYCTPEPLCNEQFLSPRQKPPMDKGKEETTKKETNGMHTIDEQGGDFQASSCTGAVPRTNSLLSLMCIPLCAFLYKPF